MKITGYHATDKTCAADIIQNRFILKANCTHWLGNGIYFFNDKCLADWWTTNPTNKYGVEIKSPAIVKVTIDIPREKVLDLRNLDEYTETIKDLKAYFQKTFNINISCFSPQNINWNLLQCAFFNYYKDRKNKKIIIGSFNSEEQPYKTENKINLLDYTRLQYVETQMCLQEDAQNFIICKEII